MCKRIVLVAAVLFAACGTEHGSSPASPDQPSGPGPTAGPGTGIPLPRLIAGATKAKVIVKRNSVVSQPIYDDSNNVVGYQDVLTEVFKYIRTIDSTVTSIAIPEGVDYTVEIIYDGTSDGTPTRTPILKYYKSLLFDVPVTPAKPTGIVEVPGIAPAVDFTAIYRGLPPPYDIYTATVSAPYPFSGTWALSCGGVAGTPRGNMVQFLAPQSGTDATIGCDARFHLDRSLLNGDSATSWEFNVRPTPPVVPSGIITIP